jgi:hypothetical protein
VSAELHAGSDLSHVLIERDALGEAEQELAFR